MWCSLIVVTAAVAAATGMRFSYDGTPLAEGVVVGGAVSPRISVVGNAPQPVAQVLSGPVPVVVPTSVPTFQQPFFPAITTPTFSQTSPLSPLASIPPPSPDGPRRCSYPPGFVVHETLNGREYHLSWCSQPGRTFSYQQAEDYCRSLDTNGHPVGFHSLSLETPVEDSFITSIIRHYEVPYIWTSGYKVSPYLWKWQSCVASQYSRWSFTGRFGRSQPDNADMNENCLAILNNFYGDGIIWHDVDCSLEKYVICERPRTRDS
ncbi:uncharacterized protein LOC135115194 isoform X2 [Scylla paramamosain]|uniref:uncharacterized protein LOC135115194 isoform X2 n=1 Tax=Scylla paramamosain TaxID=85552 RepID=UPI00308284DB